MKSLCLGVFFGPDKGKFGKFSGKFGGNFPGIFFLTHRTKAQKFRGKFRSIFRKKIRGSKKIFRAKFTLQTCHLNKTVFDPFPILNHHLQKRRLSPSLLHPVLRLPDYPILQGRRCDASPVFQHRHLKCAPRQGCSS